MKLVVGLGNPGDKYRYTRHNVGFLSIEEIVSNWEADPAGSKFKAILYKCERFGENVILAMPQGYMNRSGESVAALFRYYKCEADDLLVIHDDIDLEPLKIRIKTGGGAGGHNGIRSIDEHIGSENNDYHRLKIGVGRGDVPYNSTDDDNSDNDDDNNDDNNIGITLSPSDYVLQRFPKKDLPLLRDLLSKIPGAADLIIQGKLKDAKNKFNGSAGKKKKSKKEED